MTRWEVVEDATGARMSHTTGGKETMGSTLFDTYREASEWIIANDLAATHSVREVKG